MAKILILRLTSLGDVIFTLPLACSLQKEGHEVSYIVAEKGLDVIKNNPIVKNVHFVPLKEWKKCPFSLKTIKDFFRILKEIRSYKYDIAIDCQQMFKSLFLFWFCGAKRRISVKGARELSFLGASEFVTPKADFRDYNYHIVERNLDFARYLNVNPVVDFSLPEVDEQLRNRVDTLLSQLDSTKKTVVIAPSTTWENKHWSVDNWAKVIDFLNNKCNLVFTGAPGDEKLLDDILSRCTQKIEYISLIGKTSVNELISVFSQASLVISPDSGSAHLAWACAKPAVIALFTCTPSKRFGPYGDNSKYFALTSDLYCQPCFKRKCKLSTGKNSCTKLPEAQEIINIVNKILF